MCRSSLTTMSLPLILMISSITSMQFQSYEVISMEHVKVLKALADANRLRILELLGNGEQCACVLLGNLVLSQPTLSHHMKILCDAGLVASRKEGKWIYYTRQSEALDEIAAYLQALGHTTPTDDLAADCRCRE